MKCETIVLSQIIKPTHNSREFIRLENIKETSSWAALAQFFFRVGERDFFSCMRNVKLVLIQRFLQCNVVFNHLPLGRQICIQKLGPGVVFISWLLSFTLAAHSFDIIANFMGLKTDSR